MKAKWILDVGAFRGEDAEYYLLKGFMVVSIEANPDFANAALTRNEVATAEGRYRVVNAAINEQPGEIEFFVHGHGDWSSAIRSDRFEESNSKMIHVPAITAAHVFDNYGVPYFVKIDIEGLDHLIVEEIARRDDKPLYVSFELGSCTWKAARLLHDAGYTRFALVPQRELASVRLEHPPLEGVYVDYCFTGYHSGPFGREVQSDWMTLDEIEEAIDNLDHSEGLGQWWDIHAWRGPDAALLPEQYTRALFGSEATIAQELQKRVELPKEPEMSSPCER